MTCASNACTAYLFDTETREVLEVCCGNFRSGSMLTVRCTAEDSLFATIVRGLDVIKFCGYALMAESNSG